MGKHYLEIAFDSTEKKAVREVFSIMEQIRESEYPKSKQIAQFIEDVKEHFGEGRGGADE